MTEGVMAENGPGSSLGRSTMEGGVFGPSGDMEATTGLLGGLEDNRQESGSILNKKTCPGCGSLMNRQSAQCRSCYVAERIRPENYTDRSCLKCGSSFRIHKSQALGGHGKYCSRSCARSGSPTRKRIRHVVTCATCGDRFERHLCESGRKAGDLEFCSSRCWYEFNQGENHYLWSDAPGDSRSCPQARRWRRSVLDRDAYLCRICHADSDLHVHHIHTFAHYPELRWDVANGLTLCRDCHIRFRGVEDHYIHPLSVIAETPLVIWNEEEFDV